MNEIYKIINIEFNEDDLFNHAIADNAIYTFELFDPLENKTKETCDKFKLLQILCFYRRIKKRIKV